MKKLSYILLIIVVFTCWLTIFSHLSSIPKEKLIDNTFQIILLISVLLNIYFTLVILWEGSDYLLNLLHNYLRKYPFGKNYMKSLGFKQYSYDKCGTGIYKNYSNKIGKNANSYVIESIEIIIYCNINSEIYVKINKGNLLIVAEYCNTSNHLEKLLKEKL